MCKTQKLSKQEEFDLHNRVLMLDLDQTVNGLPSLLMENKTATVRLPYTLTLTVRKDGKPHVLGEIRIG